ncbi:MAG: glycosyltransferase [Bacteroidota bacterium]
MELSVIIVNYNVRIFLENALISIQKAMSGIDGEIFVVDNASNDGSAEMLKNKFSSVHLIENEKNLGFAKANNLALKNTSGKFILLINPDTIVQEDTLSVMLNYFKENPNVGLGGCKVLNPDGTLQLACRRSFPSPWVAFTKIVGLSNIFPQTKIFGKYNLSYLSADEIQEVDAVSGSFMMLRREVYENIGGLDEDFFMYGEDLDWCYRIQKAGWKINYIPITQIIHYKGESTKRSSIDDIKYFYQSMQLFVKKHFRSALIFLPLLQLGIVLRSWIASIAKNKSILYTALFDSALVIISVICSELLWRGRLFSFPPYAYPTIYFVAAFAVVYSELMTDALSLKRTIPSSSAIAVTSAYIFLAALTFFFKEFGFSRMVTLLSGVLSIILLPGWRIVFQFIKQTKHIGRRSLIVGANTAGEELVKKLRTDIDRNYDVVGFIDVSSRRIGEKINNVEILGSVENIGRVIRQEKISEVIFSTDALAYTDILSVIATSRERRVNFRLFPSSMDVILGKSSIDELGTIPLVEIDYNLHKPINRITKRLFDIVCSFFLLITIFPLHKLFFAKSSSSFCMALSELPAVFAGRKSFVGRPEYFFSVASLRMNGQTGLYLGKKGMTGLAQINYRNEMTGEDVEKYNLYYAKNQSLLLDFEILVKTFLKLFRK